jgi:zinc protease
MSVLIAAHLVATGPSLPVETWELDNGMTVLLAEDHRLPVVAVEIRYFVGSANERQGRSGFAHLFEHLMFQGSASFDDEYFKPFEPIGGSINGTTSNDRTNYYERVPSNYLEQVLWMESDRMENLLPVLTQKKLDNQRKVVKNERRQNYEDRPYGIVSKHMAEALYPPGHPYHHLTIGSHADLTAASLDDVKAFFREYYVPANAVVTIVGDFETQEAKALVDAYFGAIPGGKRARAPQAPQPVLSKITTVRDSDQVKLPGVFLAWPTPALYADGDAAMDALASILTDGKTSRLYKPLVYEKKVAQQVVAYQASRLLSSYFVIQAIATPGTSAETLAKELMAALKQALSTPPTDDEVQRTINAWQKSFFGRVESVLKRAQLLSNYFHATGTADYFQQDLARYTELRAGDIHEAAQRWLPLDKLVRVFVLPEEQPTEKPTSKGGAK